MDEAVCLYNLKNGKMMPDRSALSIICQDTSINCSKQLKSTIPISKIASLSSGEFVGMIADDPDNRIDLKTFLTAIQNAHAALAEEQKIYLPYRKYGRL